MTSVMHVGKFFPPFAGGMEHFLADLMRGLLDQGTTVSAVVHDHAARGRGEVTDWSGSDSQGGAAGAGIARSARLYRVPTLGRSLYAPVSPRFPFWLRRAIATERPDILHLHLPNTSAFWALSIPEARRLPWIVHWHADVVPSELDRRLKLAYPLYRPFEQRLLRRARRIIVTSPPYLESSQALRAWRGKCAIVPLGLDGARVPEPAADAVARAERLWDGRRFRILSPGRLTYYKGHRYLVEAMKASRDMRALIVGEGELGPALSQTAREQGVEDRVGLLGHVATEDLHALMRTCDCLCLPSVERTEAFGMVLLEAMAHRKPAVVCDINGSGVSWVVQDGATGVVVPPADPDALAEAFRRLSTDRRALADAGDRAWERYQALFRIEQVSAEIDDLYRKTLR